MKHNFINKENGKIASVLVMYLDDEGHMQTDSYDKVEDLMEDYATYKPAEPLIKDEKIRKAVRAWAEAADIEYLAFEDYDDENVYFIDRDFEPQIWFPKKSILENPLDDGKIYTIAELCGEGEE